MRLSIASKPRWLLAEDGALLGLSAGFDFCAEHEWGIEGIGTALGLDGSADGVERRRVRTVPDTLVEVVQRDTRAIFLVRGHETYYKQAVSWLEDWLWRKKDGGLVCGWDADSFGLVAYDPAGWERMSELYKSFLDKDIAIWPQGSGLTFRILSRIGDDERKQVLAADLDKKALKIAAEATGIEAELRAAGKGWYALQPRWVREEKSAFPVAFFLNPVDQHLYESGLCTVEELKLWARNSGPVMKKPKRGAA